MRQSIGMNTQLNLIIIFILVTFALFAASLSYYKAFKVNNVIINSIEKYEGFNEKSKTEIENNLKSLGYQQGIETDESDFPDTTKSIKTNGYQIKYKSNANGGYSYEVTTYMHIDLPLVSLIKISVKSKTDNISCLGNRSC